MRKNCRNRAGWAVMLSINLLSSSFAGQTDSTARPVALDTSTFPFNPGRPPVFSWKTQTVKPGWQQSAWRITAAFAPTDLVSETNLLWDSGKVVSQQQLFVPYAGSSLPYGSTVYWKVRVWDDTGTASEWSEPSVFHVPLNPAQPWPGEWISASRQHTAAMPLLRRQFELNRNSQVQTAKLIICGLGYYEAWLNGRKIGDRVLDPMQTNYEDYGFYSVYFINPEDIAATNVLGVMLGDGWFNQNVVWNKKMRYGTPTVRCFLQISYADGEEQTVASDLSWQWQEGPMISANVYTGETYDARREISGWSEPGTGGSGWIPVTAATNFPPKLVEQAMEPIRRIGTLPVKKTTRLPNGKVVFDFGQNMAGWVRLQITGRSGQTLTLRFAEMVDEAGAINPASTGVNATKVVQTDTYICKGEESEIWEPRFTYHGFRYVEVSGLEKDPEPGLLTAVTVHNDLPGAGHFSCSSEQINRLHQMALWTLRSNLHGVMSDCPHRERCGWTGDIHVAAPAMVSFFDARRFLTKYLYDLRSSARNEYTDLYFSNGFQDRSSRIKPIGIPTMIVPGKRTSGIASPDWGTVAVQLPWLIYQHYGDLETLREFYPDMKSWVDYIGGLAVNIPQFSSADVTIQRAVYGDLNDPQKICDVTDSLTDQVKKGTLRFPVKLLPVSRDPAPRTVKTLRVEYSINNRILTATAREGAVIDLNQPIPAPDGGIIPHGLGDWSPCGTSEIDTPVPLTSTAFHYLDLSILVKSARLLGYTDDAEKYALRRTQVCKAFNTAFFDPVQQSYGTQTADAMALQTGLTPPESRLNVAKDLTRKINLVQNGFLRTGIFGLGRVFPALAENGQTDTAYDILLKTGNPSFAQMWEVFDATTLWESLPVDASYGKAINRSHNHPMQSGFVSWLYQGIAGICSEPEYPAFKHFFLRPAFTSKLNFAGASQDTPYGTVRSAWRWNGSCLSWEIQIPPNTTATAECPSGFIFEPGGSVRKALSSGTHTLCVLPDSGP